MEGTLSLFEWSPPVGPVGREAAPTARDSGAPMPADAATATESRGARKGKPGKKPRLAAAPVEVVSAPPAATVTAAAASSVSPSAVVPVPVPAPALAADGGIPVAIGPAPSSGSVRALGTGPVAHTARVLVFDCETTGTDRTRDQVIELCVQHGLDTDAPSQVWRIKPTAAIHPGAQAVHGITALELADCPPFEAVAAEIAAVFAEAEVIVGYNLTFDIDMLQAEYTRIGQPLLDFGSKKIVDAFRLWQQCEPRSLMHAHQRFVGNEFAAAHSASADVAATGRVLAGMLRHFDLDALDWEQIASKADPTAAQRASWVGPSRHLRWEGDIVVLGFGKHSGAALHELAAGSDRGFLKWVIGKDFPAHVAEVCKAALEMSAEPFLAWARERHGPPPPPPPA